MGVFVFTIKNLDTADVAERIEQELKKQPYIKKAKVDFSSAKMKIITKPKYLDEVFRLIKNMEKDIDIIKGERIDVIVSPFLVFQLMLGLILLLLALIIKNENIARILYFSSYSIFITKLLFDLRKAKYLLIHSDFIVLIASFGGLFLKEYFISIMLVELYTIGKELRRLIPLTLKERKCQQYCLEQNEVNVIQGQNLAVKQVEELKAGELFLLKPGNRVPVDAIIHQGKSYFTRIDNFSSKVFLEVGDEILAGDIVEEEGIVGEVLRPIKHSRNTKINNLMEKDNFQEDNVNHFNLFYNLFLLLSSGLLIGIYFITQRDYNQAGLLLLLVMLPWIFTLHYSFLFLVVKKRLVREKIIIKSLNILDSLVLARCVIFNYNSGIVEEDLAILRLETNIDRNEFLRMISHLEYNSDKWYPKIIKNFSEEIQPQLISDFQEESGLGLVGKYSSLPIFYGNIGLFNKYQMAVPVIEEKGIIHYLYYNNEFSGYLILGNILKGNASKIKEKLMDVGIQKTIIIGQETKEDIASINKNLQFDQEYGELSLADLLKLINQIASEEKGKIIYIASGINDAPILQRADIGIAIGSSADLASQAADVILADNDISKIPLLMKIAKKTQKIFINNLIFGFVMKIVVVILLLLKIIPLWSAVGLDIIILAVMIVNLTRILK